MRPLSLGRSLLAALALSLCASGSLLAQLDRTIEAHGGRATWDSYGSVEYDLSWAGAKGTKHDHELFDLHSRDGLITSERYTLGAHEGQVWIKPDAAALGGTPPRFYMWTPFYFFGMPFVFGDHGVKQESLGRKPFQGQDYEVVKVTYEKGTGDTPDDFYLAYIDPATAQLKLAVYIVTYPTMRKDKPIDQLETHAIVFQEWQKADGLQVPKRAPFYQWKNDTIEGEPLATLEFSNVRFAKEAPSAAKFAQPTDAVDAPLQ